MIRFGTAGNPESFYARGGKATVQMPEYLRSFGLNAYEYSCGRGVHVSEKTARQIGEKMAEYGIAVSVHAPYFINFANLDSKKRESSQQYLAQAVELAVWLGAGRVIFHSGVQGTQARADVHRRIADEVRTALGLLNMPGASGILLCPETMGRPSQFGGLEEILSLCAMDERLLPTLDMGHLNCLMQGALRTQDDFAAVLQRVEDVLGQERLRHVHMHFSHIAYGPKGEIKHLTGDDTEFGPHFTPLAREIVRRRMEPTVISESAGTQAEDAARMQQRYLQALKETNENGENI